MLCVSVFDEARWGVNEKRVVSTEINTSANIKNFILQLYPHHIIQLFGFCVLFISFYRNVRVEWPRSKFNEQKEKEIVREQVRAREGGRKKTRNKYETKKKNTTRWVKNDHQMRKHAKKSAILNGRKETLLFCTNKKKEVANVMWFIRWLMESEKISEKEFHFPLLSLPSRFD